MNRANRFTVAVLATASLAAAAGAQTAFILAGKQRPVPGGESPTSSFRITPTYHGEIGFRHWNLREFPNCAIPYQLATPGSADTTTTPAASRDAVAAGFTSWQNVNPSLIAFDRRPDRGNAAGQEPQPGAGCPSDPAPGGAPPPTRAMAARRDCRNLMLWDNRPVGAPHGPFGAAPSGTLAITFTWTNANAVAQESDILFNDRDWQWTNAMSPDRFRRSRELAAGGTYALAAGDTLDISINGGAVVTVTFNNNARIPDVTAATPAQVAAEINNRLGAAGAANFVVGTLNGARRVAIGSNRARDGGARIDVSGGTANAAGKLEFPTGELIVNGADIQTIAVHEIGHLCGFQHTSQREPEPNAAKAAAVMYFSAPDANKRNLTALDADGANFLYTPDLGDAPDPAAGNFNQFQTRVHGNANGRMLNDVQLSTVGLGPDHLFGNSGPYRFEWLGADEDGSANECEARVPDLDNFDDGVTIFPAPPLIRGQTNHVRAKIKNSGFPGRYRLTANDDTTLRLPGGVGFPDCGDRVAGTPPPVNVPYIGPGPNGVIDTAPNNCNIAGGDDQIANVPNPGPGGGMIQAITTGADGIADTDIPEPATNNNPARTILYLNGYVDLNNNNLFDPAERLMFFSDIPNATLGPAPAARSLNFRSVSINGFVNETEVAFDLFVPRNAPANLRFRFRLDYGEDEGRVPLATANGWEGDLAPATGAAQFGEVEDYVFPTQAGPPVPDQLHLRGPYLVPIRPPNSPNQPSWLEAWVENNFLGASGQEVRFEVLSANAYFSNMNVTPNGLQASAVTGLIGGNPQLPGLVNAGVSGSVAGDGLIKVTVTDSPLVAYYVFKIPAARVIGDTTGDAAVGFDDIPLVLANFGQSGMPNIAGDANEDGLVNFADITSVLSNFGAKAP